MICIKTVIPKGLNEFIERIKGMVKAERKTIYQEYQS